MTLQKKLSDFKTKLITKIKKVLYQVDKPIYNIFHTSHKKFALISYITAPFRIGNQNRHNNEQISYEIANVLNELGYVVDVIHYLDNKDYAFDKYSLIIGFGNPFCNSFKSNNHAKRIYYGTGMEVSHQNYATIKRLRDFHAKHNIWLPESARIVDQTWSLQTQAVDGIATYGNETIFDSYKKYYDGPIYPLHTAASKFRESKDILAEKKDWAVGRKNFFFSFGAGAIHKCFDIVLDLFAKHPEWELHIAAPIGKEKRFFDIYKETLELPNIHHYGFLTVKSQENIDIISKCGFYLSPSASEGCPTTVVNCCANSKCIPLANKENGLEGDFIIPIAELTEQALETAILYAQSLTDTELENMATEAHNYYSSVHTIEHYRKELRTAVSGILENEM